MVNKIITQEGKEELLRLGFASEEAGGAFKYVALGGESSKASQTGNKGDFMEVTGPDYYRATATVVGDIQNKSITITATFDENNLDPSEGEIVKEVALCNDDSESSTVKYFMFSQVPPIAKTGDISLQYTFIISID